MSRRFSHSRGAGGFNRGRGKRSNGFISPTAKPVWDSEDLIPFQKNFYREHSAVTNRSPAQLEEFMKSCRMSFENTKIKPIMSFPEICFPRKQP
ncbi:hypothetical protein GJ496_007873 [Pomphorhynchus laevis]|nr:hypothetical protein GJ496_007873 [Pomphorhynchus laevis]